MKNIEIESVWKGPEQCRECGIRNLVLFADLEHDDFELIHKPIDEISIDAGVTIYHAGDEANFVYTLREGMVKLSQSLPDGSQRIVRLLKQGDVIGLEATMSKAYQHDATTLEPIKVCRIPLPVIDRLSKETPRIYNQLITRWHNALNTADTWLTELSTGPAQARVARLLIRMADCHSDNSFYLPGREDIGAIVGITTETASRVIADFKRMGCIQYSEVKKIRIDMACLNKIASK